MAESHRPVIALDFDGVLHSYASGWTGEVPVDLPTHGADLFLPSLVAHARLVVYSCRAQTLAGREGILAWLKQHGLAPYIDEVTAVKPHADLYVDDRALRFTGNWMQVLVWARDRELRQPWFEQGAGTVPFAPRCGVCGVNVETHASPEGTYRPCGHGIPEQSKIS